jgi:aspartyl protease family protein
MALSYGGRSVALEVAGWGVVAAMAVAGLMFAKDIRDFGYATLGIPRPEVLAQRVVAARTGTKPVSASLQTGRPTVELHAQRNGHYFSDVEINGRRIGVMVDSGASSVALSYEHASSLGIYVKDSDFTWRSNTANGVIAIAPVTIDKITLGDITVRGVQGTVSAQGVQMEQPLLGMSFLSRLSKVEMNAGRLILQE